MQVPLVDDSVLVFAAFFAFWRAGDIWSFQVVLFPLWRLVPKDHFRAYHDEHFRRIKGVIFVPMGLSALSAILLWFFPPPYAPRGLLLTALGLQAALFLSLIYWIPLQLRLEREGNRPELVRKLVVTHWTRVANITAFAIVILWLVWVRLRTG